MAKVSAGSARAAAIVGFLIICCGIPITTCGVIWVAYHGYLGHGLWSGIPLLVTGFFGFLSLTRNNVLFTLYLLLSVVTSILAGIQAITAGLELLHWNQFIGDDKCSVTSGACKCRASEEIRINDLDSCDKIPTINDMFITMIFFSIIGSLVCLGGAIAGCVGLATVPRSQPTTLPRKPKPKKDQTPSGTLALERNNYPANDVKKPDHVDSGHPVGYYTDHDRHRDDRRDDHYTDKDRYRDDRRDDYYTEKDRFRDDRRDDYHNESDRNRDDRRDDNYRDDRRDDYYDNERHRDDRRDDYYDKYSDRSYDSYDRRSHERDSYRDDYDDRRSHEGRKTPTYL